MHRSFLKSHPVSVIFQWLNGVCRRTVLCFAVVVGCNPVFAAVAARATNATVLIATYTQGTSRGIYRATFSNQTGALSSPSLAAALPNPSWFVVNAAQTRLFAVSEMGSQANEPVAFISSFRMNPAGRLSLINRVNDLGDEPTHLALSRDERYLFVSNYALNDAPGGMLNTIPVDATGKLEPITQAFSFVGSHADPERQLSSHIHSAVLSPEGNFVFVCDLGADRVYTYRLRHDDRHQRPLQRIETNLPQLPPGAGPRHLVFSPDGKHAYLTYEMLGQVVVLDYNDGTLTPRQSIRLAPAEIEGRNSAAAIHVSADGRFVYATNRGTYNQLVTLRVQPQTNQLELIQRVPVHGIEPREFALSPDGHFVLIANQKSNEIVTLRRDPASGLIGEVVSRLALSMPSQIVFIH